jgi:hypothetical protein
VDAANLVKKPAGEVVRYDRGFLLRFSQVQAVHDAHVRRRQLWRLRYRVTCSRGMHVFCKGLVVQCSGRQGVMLD